MVWARAATRRRHRRLRAGTARARRGRRPPVRGHGLGNLASQRFLRGELVEARAAHQEALAVSRHSGTAPRPAEPIRTSASCSRRSVTSSRPRRRTRPRSPRTRPTTVSNARARCRASPTSTASAETRARALGRGGGARDGRGRWDARRGGRGARGARAASFHVGDYDRAVRLPGRPSGPTRRAGRARGSRPRHSARQHPPRAARTRRGEGTRARLAAWEALGQRRSTAPVLANLGLVLRERGEPARALVMYERAGRIQTDAGDRRGAALTLGNVGSVRRDLRESSKAAEAFQRAIDELDGCATGRDGRGPRETGGPTARGAGSGGGARTVAPGRGAALPGGPRPRADRRRRTRARGAGV